MLQMLASDTVTMPGWRTKVGGGRVTEHPTRDAADAAVEDARRRYRAARALRVVRVYGPDGGVRLIDSESEARRRSEAARHTARHGTQGPGHPNRHHALGDVVAVSSDADRLSPEPAGHPRVHQGAGQEDRGCDRSGSPRPLTGQERARVREHLARHLRKQSPERSHQVRKKSARDPPESRSAER